MTESLRGIQWLEEQTGEDLSSPVTPRADRHFSVRLPAVMLERLAAMAEEAGVTTSELVRRTVATTLESRQALRDRSTDELIEEISALVRELQVRRHQAA